MSSVWVVCIFLIVYSCGGRFGGVYDQHGSNDYEYGNTEYNPEPESYDIHPYMDNTRNYDIHPYMDNTRNNHQRSGYQKRSAIYVHVDNADQNVINGGGQGYYSHPEDEYHGEEEYLDYGYQGGFSQNEYQNEYSQNGYHNGYEGEYSQDGYQNGYEDEYSQNGYKGLNLHQTMNGYQNWRQGESYEKEHLPYADQAGYSQNGYRNRYRKGKRNRYKRGKSRYVSVRSDDNSQTMALNMGRGNKVFIEQPKTTGSAGDVIAQSTAIATADAVVVATADSNDEVNGAVP